MLTKVLGKGAILLKTVLFATLCLLMTTSVLAAADVEAGKAAYDKACRSCHGADGKGNPAIAKAMKVELRALGSKEVQAKSDAELAKDITQGVGKMKPVKMADDQVKNVVAYMRTMKP
jgi:cytochrome c553